MLRIRPLCTLRNIIRDVWVYLFQDILLTMAKTSNCNNRILRDVCPEIIYRIILLITGEICSIVFLGRRSFRGVVVDWLVESNSNRLDVTEKSIDGRLGVN